MKFCTLSLISCCFVLTVESSRSTAKSKGQNDPSNEAPDFSNLTFSGFLYEGTMVSVNAWALHHCEETWGDPYVFRPERFLNEDETTLIKQDHLFAFGFGKRTCPGIGMAYEELFLFITRIFQEFSITWNPKEEKPNMIPRLGAALTPSPHTLIISQRTPQL